MILVAVLINIRRLQGFRYVVKGFTLTSVILNDGKKQLSLDLQLTTKPTVFCLVLSSRWWMQRNDEALCNRPTAITQRVKKPIFENNIQ